MWWVYAAQGAQQGLAGIASATRAYMEQANSAMQEEDALLQNTAENKAIAEANLQNVIRTGYRTGIQNIQRAQAKRRAQEAGFDLSAATGEVLGANSANAAAAGAVGPSVNAVMADIAVKTDQARAQQDEDARVVQENFDIQMRDLVNAGIDAQRAVRAVNVRNVKTSVPSYLEIAFSAGAAVAVSYGQSQIRAGALGSKAAPAAPAPGK